MLGSFYKPMMARVRWVHPLPSKTVGQQKKRDKLRERQVLLKDMVAPQHDIIDQELQSTAGSLSSVTKWEKLWLAQVFNCRNEWKVVSTQVMVT